MIQTCHTSSCRVEPLLVLPVSNLLLVTLTFFVQKQLKDEHYELYIQT